MLKALVSGIAVFRGGAWRKGLDHKGSDFTDGLIPGRFIARRHCWEIMEAQEAGPRWRKQITGGSEGCVLSHPFLNVSSLCHMLPLPRHTA